ncbi:MAG: hypothetical protein ABL857_05535 [Rickettsiales bacterium]|jgi:hypothetical protein
MYYDNNAEIVVNNVQLPNNVVRELQRLGRSLKSYTHGELQSAVIACAFDGRLIDDPDGDNFMDKLVLTDEEVLEEKSRKERDCEREEEECVTNKIVSFCQRLKERHAKHAHPNNDFCCT